MATVCGVIQRVNKLISVVPVKNRYATLTLLLQFLQSDKSNSTSGMAHAPHRYNPELGDVVVGRVTEVSAPTHCEWNCRPGIMLHQQSCCILAMPVYALQVANKRWRVDLRSRQAAALMLSAVNLPGGVQVCVCHSALQMPADEAPNMFCIAAFCPELQQHLAFT